jgi:hypothetical protein
MMFWNGFATGCLAVIVSEIIGIIAYAVKRGNKK